MEAAVRLVQGGGPNGQRMDGAGGGQQAQQQQNALTHQVRTVPPQGVPPGVAQVRPMDHQPAYASKLQAPMQKVSRTSPLSPPRTAATTYSCYPGTVVRDPGARYTQQMPYRQVHQMDYHRLVSNVSSATNSLMVGGGSGVPGMHEASPPGAVENRQRISLLPYGAGGFLPSAQTRQMGQPEHELDGQPPPGIKRILNLGDGPVMMKMDDTEPTPGSVYQTRIKNICVDDMTGQMKMDEPSYEPRIKKMCVDEGTSGLLKMEETDPAAGGGGAYQQGIKRIRLGEAPGMLKIEVPDAPPAAGAYHPQVEAISPTLPGDSAEELRATKDDLLQQISKVDSEIGKVEKSIELLKKKEASLQEASAKPPATEEASEIPPKHRSLAQKIYAENKRKASMAHAMLSSLGPPIDLPLYNQPSDVEACREIIQRNVAFKPRLLLHCQKIKSEKSARSVAFAECYFQKSQEWLRRVEKNEASAKRKTKEAKNREFFEKVFPELRKQREDKERFNRVGSRIKSEADLEEIMDGLQEQAMEDKKMRSYAVIPPLMLDTHQKKYYFINENGAMADMEADFKDRQHLNLWTTGEKEMFKEKFLQHPKNFGAIAVSLDRKSAQDCVRYYYLSKKTDNYKQLLRKARQRTRSSKNPQKSTINQSQCIIDALTTGVTTRLQREQQQKIGVRDRSTATSTASNQSSGAGNSTAGSGTATPVSSVAAAAAAATVATSTAAAASVATTTTTGCTSTTSTALIGQTPVNSQPAGAVQEGAPAASAAEGAAESSQPTVTASGQNHVENESQQTTSSGGETFSGFSTRKDDAPSEGGAATEKSTNSAEFGAIDTHSVPLHQMESHATSKKDLSSITLERTGKDDSTEIIAVDKDVLQFCFVCKATLCSRSRPLEKSRCKQYGIPEGNLIPGARVCNTCQCKSLRSKYSSCPLPTCPNAKDRVKRFRNLPTRLFDLAADVRDAIVAEFQIPPGVQKCCSACLIRIRRKLAPHIQTAVFTDEEIGRLKVGLTEWGHNWQKLEEVMGKPVATVRMFYSINRKKCGLEEAVGEYYKKNPGEMREMHHGGELSDVDESDFSTSSCDEREANSDTASAESPSTNPPQNLQAAGQIPIQGGGGVVGGASGVNKVVEVEALTAAGQMVMTKKPEEERAVQPEPAKRHSMKSIEECDSSATETADEENELSPANRQSPKVLLYPNQTTITMLPFSGQNGPREVSSPPQNVRDVVLNVIERSLKTSQGPQMSTQSKVGIIKTPFSMEPRTEMTYMRGDVKEPPAQHPSDTLATISVLNSQNRALMTAQAPPQHHPGVSQATPGQFAATITPVPLTKGPSLDMQKEQQMKMYATMRTEPEPQTLDLSVKKTQVREVTPTQQKNPTPTQAQMANNVVAMLRTEAGQTQMSLPQQTVSPNHLYQTHQAYHQQQAQVMEMPARRVPMWCSLEGGRSAKSPSVFVPISVGAQQQMYHQVPSTRATAVTAGAMMKSKMSPKPQMQQPQPPTVGNPGGGGGGGGPKGSITHGTPVSSVSQPATFLLQAPPSASPRFDAAPQPAPEKIGSITQGTPVHMPPHHLNDKHRVYEYYKNSRQSPAQQTPQSSPQANFGPSYARSFGMDQQQLSSRQIIVNDYFTSQQMIGQARGVRTNQPTPEKDSHSPRNVATINAGNVAMYYDKERQRSEYMSRSSPADNANSLNHSLKTPPPPQRQGVIQRHNTGGSKPSSPAPNRLHVMQHHYPPPPGERMAAAAKERDRQLAGATLAGHEAFSSLVDVAVQQPLLPVPQDKRPPAFQGSPATHHDIRLMAFQLHQHQQFQQMQQLDMKLESQKRHGQHMPGSTFEELQQFERERREEHFAGRGDGHAPSHELLERHAQLERDLHADHERLMERDAMLASASEERAAMHTAEMEKAAAAEQEQQRRLAIAAQQQQQQQQQQQPPYDQSPKVTARQILDRDRERSERSLLPPRSTDGTLTAANLIDAIITHQINQSASEPPPVSVSRALHKSGFFTGRDLHSGASVYENSGGSGGGSGGGGGSNQSGNVIKIGFDSEAESSSSASSRLAPGSGGTVMTKNITIGQLTDSIIQKDFGPNPFHPLRQTQFMQYPTHEQLMVQQQQQDQWGRRLGGGKDGIVTVDRLKKMEEVVKKDDGGKESGGGKEGEADDGRQVSGMRMTAPSPNHAAALKSVAVSGDVGAVTQTEPSGGGPFYHLNDTGDRRQHGGGAAPTIGSHQTKFALDCYVKNRIVEAMRTEDEKRSDDREREMREMVHMKQQQQQQQGGGGGYGKMEVVVDKSEGGGGATAPDDSSSRPPSGGVMMKQPPPQSFAPTPTSVTSFSSSAYHYPYSALNVTPAPPTSIATVAIAKTTEDARPQQPEPKPLLSAQYEELSDEE
ncbi:uncharacterized protein LOC129794670 isoform X3 [Lutzomyia longipalpis]|uniref:uncharacterized protein LOC129794670 isoform X3 n=1 Tax=Lutzomyia longipalpis TaxID=7200 RepID=UPI0024835B42|nr:uncharacterized protein LOC129794670 isoform X3 [Lutzomyia longipalpis]